MSSWKYRPSLDGLRMLSMYLIVLYHAGVSWVRGSFIAVDLFFVLSGFLVTHVILNEVDRTGRLSLRDFYARRVRRLMPAAVVAILGTTLLFVLFAPAVRRLDHIGDAQAALLYVANWRYLIQADDYFAADGAASPFLHYWTLSIEEQFYVGFPLLLLALVRSRHRWALPAGLAALLLLSAAAQLYWGFVDPIHAYYGTDARAYQLLAGALLAVAMRRGAVCGLGRGTATGLATGGLLVFLALTPTSLVEVSQSARGFIATAAILAMILGLMAAEQQPLGWLLSRRWVVYLGTITYATYLWHWPFVLILDEILVVRPELLAALVAVLATAMAAASNELIELPVRRSKGLGRRPWPVVTAGVAAGVLAATVVVPQVLGSERRPVLATADAGTDLAQLEAAVVAEEAGKRSSDGRKRRSIGQSRRMEPIPARIDWKEIKDDTGDSVTCDADAADDCVVRRSEGPHVMLVGDSHAMMLTDAFRAMAEERDLTLSFNTVGSCPWQEDLENTKFGENLQERCEQSRVGWYDETLPELEPDVVVLLARPRDGDGWTRHMRRRDGRREDLPRATLKASRRTVAKIRRAGAEVVLVEQVTVPETFNPQECLATADAPIECSVPVPRDGAISNAFFRSLAAADDRVHSVDLDRAFCPGDPVCAPVVDAEIVWRDQAHVTASFARKRREQIWRILQETGLR